MKKQIILAVLIALFSTGLVFAKGKFTKLKPHSVYAVYKIVIRNDLNRDFYSKALGCPDDKDNPHLSGDGDAVKVKVKPMFKDVDLETEYYLGDPVGQTSYCQIYGKKGEGATLGPNLNLFGGKFTVILPLREKFNVGNFGRVERYKVTYDASTKYVYLGTFVYDFVDGTCFPKLLEVRDEYDEAQNWLNERVGKEVLLSRVQIE